MTDWGLTEEGVREQPLWTGVGVATVAVKELRKLKFRGVPVVQLLSLTANVLEAESEITGSEDFADELRLRAALLRALTGGDEE